MAPTTGVSGDARPDGGAKVPTIAEIRAVIPKSCFQHSLVRAFGLVIRDALVMLAFFCTALLLLRVPGDAQLSWLDVIGWAVYGFAQGSAMTGWWVIGHECGHGGFSQYQVVNDTVGWLIHSALLVPFFSWQYSHGKHHSKTNHLVDGETHVPDTREDVETLHMPLLHRLLGDDSFAMLQLIMHLVFGWPAYLFFNATGGRRLQGQSLQKPVPVMKGGLVDHFRPNSALFPDAWRVRVGLSTLGVALAVGAIVWACRSFGFGAVAVTYLVPYMWVNFWLVLYTWLQHTDPEVPHYGDEDWTWVKGALGTIDRPYGIFDWMHHHIGSTHVCHHLFSSLPCYNAVEATAHLKAYLEPRGLYNYDPAPWPRAAWRVAKTCHFVEGVHGTQYFKSLGKGKEQ